MKITDRHQFLGDRGTSEVLGFVLLIGMVLTSAMVVFYFGTALMTDLQTQTQGENAEQSMREVDSRLSEVALSDNLEHTLAFDGSNTQKTRIADDATMTVELRNESGDACTFEIPMGSLHYETADHSTVTYQGGGIWKETPSGNTMVSSPDMEYRDGTLTFPSVNINGTVHSNVDTLRAKKNITHSERRSQEYEDTMRDCVGDSDDDASEMTITVESSYADVWGHYLEREVSDDVRYDLNDTHPDESSVNVTIAEGLNATIGDEQNEVVVDENSTVDVTVLGTEVSTEGCFFGCTKRWEPISMQIIADGDEINPWPDNLNTRSTQLTEWTESFEVKPIDDEVSITLSSTWWDCDTWTGAGSDSYGGSSWDHYDCASFDDTEIEVDATADENPENVRVLADGDEMPVLETSHRQRNAEEVLGPRLNDTGHLQLEDNQVVFLFELTDGDADWDDANDGVGDPNYNDVIALLEIEEQEGTETSGGFDLRLSTTEIVIEPAS